jgi:hypothetical protein
MLKITAGDAVLLSGTIDADRMPEDAEWAGAVLKMNIAKLDGTVVVNHADLASFDLPTKAYSFVGAPITEVGLYAYEIEVTNFVSRPSPLSFPNGRKEHFQIVAQVA